MFNTIRLGRIFGIPITIHWSLLLLAGWYVTSGFNEGGIEMAFSRIGVPVAVFASVLLHELGHVLVARGYGIGTKSINLSPLGGIAFLDRYPEKPGARAAVALGGPAVSLALALVFAVVALSGYEDYGLATPSGTLFLVNAILLIFNMLPIHPMDGGQVMVALVMKVAGNKWADGYAKYSGRAGAFGLFAAGLYLGIFSFMLIGAFLLVVSLFEYGNPFRSRRDAAAKASKDDAVYGEETSGPVLEGEIDVPPRGVFVAFDGAGRHFAYAKHWIGSGDEDGQKATIREYAREARSKGGELRFLSIDEYRRTVLEPGHA